ncbi:MAG: metalloregulator ArsR/SmtB family transcription factor [Planctomycetota bacterium]
MNDVHDRLYELKADLIKAAAHPIRLAIIDCLRDGEECVCRIAEQVEAERSNVSRHLALMTKAGLIDSRKDGLKVFCGLQTPCILEFLACADRWLRERIERETALLDALEPE